MFKSDPLTFFETGNFETRLGALTAASDQTGFDRLFGVGLGSLSGGSIAEGTVISSYGSFYNFSLVHLGMIGTAILFLLLVALLRAHSSNIWLIGLFLFLLSGTFIPTLLFFWLFLAALAVGGLPGVGAKPSRREGRSVAPTASQVRAVDGAT
ncbi:MAG: hypothetical protein HC888_18145 [Candidatus Competibacteraceae bacterium]|nr:hypothetical protein [Candidatus Competibacteraceae bacterium]